MGSRWNHAKVFVLMAALTALLGAAGQALGGPTGAVLAIGFAAVSNVAMYFWSSNIVLRMYGARVVTAADEPSLYDMVDRLRRRAGLPMPTLAVAPHPQPNAFATGRNPANGVVCVTRGLLAQLDRDEMEGVIAHELAHIRNRDMLLQTITATIAGAISNLANLAMFSALFGRRDDDGDSHPAVGLLALIVAPIAASLIQLAISRQREFEADRVGAEISGKPRALARALTRLAEGAHHQPMDVSPAAAPLAQVNPLGPRAAGLLALFSTHPPTDERVRRLLALDGGPTILRAA